MKPLPLSSEMSVPDVLTANRSLSAVFLRHKTACVGCPLARFCTLRDVARTYGLSMDAFLAELEQVALADSQFLTGAQHEKTS
jgi:hybrid cluster-associated redox disulfide protein